MKRTIKTTITNILSLAMILLASCTVGLGDAVDTANPTIDISYPPKNAVVRQSFVAAGTCDDDLDVASVQVTVTETSTKKAYGPYDAQLNEEGTAWTVTLNQKSDTQYSSFEAYKQWEFPDGDYIVSAISYDKKNNASQESSVPISIDNTPPVLLVSKPLAVGNENPSVYGRALNIVGDISEVHETSKLTLYYKEYDETDPASFDSVPTKTLEISGFGTMSSDSPLTIAKLVEQTSQTSQDDDVLTQNYKTIYGQDSIDITQSNKKTFYCGFLLEDSAKIYQNPDDSGVTGGNQTSNYYILSDDYNDNLFSENTYSLNARNLMLLLSGKSSYSQSQITQITELLQKNGNSASSKTITAAASTKFSVDPRNNPMWSITNFDIVGEEFNTYELGSAIPLVLEAGGDGIAVDKSTIQIELYHLASQSDIISSSTPHLTLIQRGQYTDGKLKEALNQPDSTYDFGNGDVGLKINNYYEIVIDEQSTDVDGNELMSKNGRYGFKRYSTFAPPSISFETATGCLTENDYIGPATLNSPDGIKIKGKIVTATKDITIPSKDNIILNKITVGDKTVPGGNTGDYTVTITNFKKDSDGDSSNGKSYTFIAEITAKSGKSLDLNSTEPGIHKYKVNFSAIDSLNGGQSESESYDFEFNLDNAKPVISVPTISPTVNKTENSLTTTYVNGEIKVSGTVSDVGSGFKTLKYGIDTTSSAGATDITDKVSGTNWSFEYNTTGKETGTETLKIYAIDSVGNEEVVSTTLKIDQSTDYPVIEFSNADIMFTKESNILLGTVTDDDGLKTVTATYEKTSPVPGTGSFELGTLTNGTTSYSINAKLPASDEGEYKITVYAEDVPGLETGNYTSTINVKKDNGAPLISITSPNTNSQNWYKGQVTVTGKAKDGSGVVNITRTVKKGTTAIDDLTQTIDVSDTATAEKIVAGTATWSDTINFASASEGSGTYTVTYTAVDKYPDETGHTSTITASFLVDVNNPEVKDDDVKLDNKKITQSSGWSNTSNPKLTVKATDKNGESGLDTVQYNINNSGWKNMALNASTNTWEADISFATSNSNNLKVRATDKAGNESESGEGYTLKIDTVNPTITVTATDPTDLTGNVYVNKTKDVKFTVKIDDANSGFDSSSLKIEVGSTPFTATEDSDATDNSKTYNVTLPSANLVDGLLKITATDIAGNTTEKEYCTFIVDKTAPTIENVTLAMENGTVYKKADDEYYIRNKTDGKLTISGISTEANEFNDITLSITGGPAFTPVKKTTTTWSFADIDLSAQGWKNAGQATVTLTTKDKVGNTAQETFTIKFDETAPEIIPGAEQASYKFRGADVIKFNNIRMGDGRYSESSYGRSSATKFSVYLEDNDGGSGVQKLEYKLWASDKDVKTEDELKAAFDKASGTTGSLSWSSSGSFSLAHRASGTGTDATANISGFKPTSADHFNYLLLRPIDNCGTPGQITVLHIKIDQTAPEVIAVPVNKLTNGTTPITITGSVVDYDAGLKALYVILDDDIENPVLTIDSRATAVDNGDGTYTATVTADNYGSFAYTAPYTFGDSADTATWSLTLDPSKGTWFKNATHIVKILAEDWAELDGVGNKAPNPTKVAVIKKDTTAPTVTVTSPTTGSSVNGVYTITGTSSDTGSNPAKLAVYYAKTTEASTTGPTDIDDYEPITGAEKTVGQNGVLLAQLTNYSFDINFFDSNLIDDATQDSGETQYVWILVQATDEAGNTSAISPVKYKIDRNQDRPTVTFSDNSFAGMSSSDYTKVIFGEKTVYISVTDDDGEVQSIKYRVGGTGSFVTVNNFNSATGTGSINLGDNDGEKIIEFQITDKNGTVFESGASKQWNRIILEDKDGAEYGNTTTSTNATIYATLDTTPPTLDIEGIKAPDDSEYATLQNFTKTLGGATDKITLKVNAIDSGSGIKEVKAIASVEGKTDVEVTKDTPDSDGYYYIEVPCDKTKFADVNGTLKLSVTAKDNADRERQQEKQFNIDNVNPGITVSTPEENSEQSGSLLVSGYFTESVKFYYAVSPIETFPDDYASVTKFTYTKNTDTGTNNIDLPAENKAGTTIIPEGTTQANYLSYVKSLCNYVEYSSDDISTFTLSLDGSGADNTHSSLLNTWLTKIGITNTTDLGANTNFFDDIVTIYLQLKAVDDAGNIYRRAYPIHVDPQGNRPKIEFSYPSKDMGDEPTLGGTINLIGSATGKNQVTKVYMQIDTNNDNNWDATDIDNLDKADNDTGATDGKYFTYPIRDIPDFAGQKGIEIEVNGTSWSQRINISHEFNPSVANTTNPIHLRLFAVDVKGTRGSAKTKTIRVDADVPYIGQDLTLVQWDDTFSGTDRFTVEDGNIKFTDGAVKARREYNDGMYVKGAWYLIGTVNDAGGISKITIDGNKENGTNLIGGDKVKEFTKDGATNYAFCLPVGSATNVGQTKIEFYAKDTDQNSNNSVSKNFVVNYDNTPPVVTELAQSYKKVLNNNGYYNLKSVATENPSVTGDNQSGVERIAFFFTRATTDPKTIFDPMIKSDADGNKVTYTGTLEDLLEDGLYWQSAAVTVNGTALTLAANTDITNIHKGGLAKVNGTIYRINGITTNKETPPITTITLSGAPGTATTAKFAIANVIDNTSPEDVPDSNVPTGKGDYGYGYADPESELAPIDDGDLMPERCITIGTQCNWEANINSKNMTDGPVTLHYVVFDKAGNYRAKTLECVVQNNSPRLAGAYIGTDEDGNGYVDWSATNKNGFNGEFKAYHLLFKNGYNGVTKVTNLTIPAVDSQGNRASAITVKRDLAVLPEIIGGVGDLKYTYQVETYTSGLSDKLADGNGDSNEIIDLGSKQILITVKDILTNRSKIPDGEQEFIFTIWDSTQGLTPGTNSQSATLNVKLNVALNDTTPAKNKIIPFYWKSKSENSLKDNDTKLGHIDLSKDLIGIKDTDGTTDLFTTGGTGIYTLNPKISGAVKLEGIAQDNSLLKELYVTIAGYKNGAAQNILSYANGSWAKHSLTETDATKESWSSDYQHATYDELLAAGYLTQARYNELTADGTGIKGTDEVPYASQEFGHVVHWIMNIDTEAMGLTPKAGIEITVSATDYGAPTLSGSTVNYNDSNTFTSTANGDGTTPAQTGGNNGQASHTCKYSVDLVPYITRIKTALSTRSSKEDTSEYDRTSLGHYPVKEDESIVIEGFNLGGNVKFKTADATVNATYNANGVAIPETAVSGEISIVNGVESLNNMNSNNAKGDYSQAIPTDASRLGDEDTYEIFTNCYNRKPNTSNNYILTDDVVLDVWQFDGEAAKPYNKGVISDPIMKINPSNGIIGFAYQSGTKEFSMADGNTSSFRGWIGDYDNLSATGFAYDSAGNTYGTALGGDINSSYSVSKFCFVSSLWQGQNTDQGGALGGAGGVRIEEIGQVGKKGQTNAAYTTEADRIIDKTRVLSPSIAVSGSGNTSTVYMAYYDHLNREIRFRWASGPEKTTTTTGQWWNQQTVTTWWNGTSYINDNYTGGTLNDANAINTHKYNTNDFQIIAENATVGGSENPDDTTTLGKPGQYVDIAVIPNGGGSGTNKFDVVVMVWYDSKNDRLLYTYNTIALNSTKDANNNTISFEGSGSTKKFWHTAIPIFTEAGQYCKIAVDGNNGIHIAGYDAKRGDVRYAYLSTYGANYDEKTNSCYADSNGIIGTNLTLDVALNDDNVPIPYIGYYGDSGPKMAYLNADAIPSTVKTTAGKSATSKDKFTGYWDVTEIPTQSNAPKDRINIGVWKTAGGVINNSNSTVAAKKNGDATTQANDSVTVGNGTKNPVVAYEIRPSAANGYMETAQKK